MRTWNFTAFVHSKSEGHQRVVGEVEAPDSETADQEVRRQARAKGRTCGSVTLHPHARR